MKRNSPYLQTLRAFIRRVTEILLRRGITARATIVEVLRRLRQRGIWPAKNQEQKESADASSPMRELSEQAQAFLATYDVVDAATEGSAALSADAASPAWLTATDIYTSLTERYSQRVLSGTPSQLGRQLTFVGVARRHTKRGTLYLVRKK